MKKNDASRFSFLRRPAHAAPVLRLAGLLMLAPLLAAGVQPQPASGAAAGAPAAAKARAKADPGRAYENSRAAIAGPNCIGEAGAPMRIAVPLGKSTLVRLPEAVVNRSTGNPAIVQGMLLSPQTLYVLGVDVGSTNMIIQGKSGACTALDFFVGIDPTGLQATLLQLMPDERNIRIHAAADTLVLSGTVTDATAVGHVLALANAYVRRRASAVHTGLPAAPGAAADAALAEGMSGQPRVVNLLGVNAPQQVMLEVKIAEVSKSLLDKLEVGAALRAGGGGWSATLLTNFLTGTANGLFDLRKSSGNQLTFEAQKQDGLIKILAEPTVMAISGQEGSFLAGGKILIPVGQDTNNGTTRITLEEKEFGVGLKFTPTVLAGGRINLRVAPEVSELSREGVGITAAGVNGTAILPLITTRRASTTVQLYDGQSFAIGGLIKNNTTANIKGLPLLSEIPVLGALFRSTDFQQDKTELVFVVTPRLVQPLAPGYSLPTDKVADPDRAALFLNGKLESAGAPARAPVAPSVPAASPAGSAGRLQQEAGGFEMK